ncbi:hypothetical protein [Streptomyces sp. NPDC051567]|uniref:hypothetical protein n=1 Tax=Streptomyces sp. NPDC051567 TaxID=3365660 RepID=UPI00378BA5C2
MTGVDLRKRRTPWLPAWVPKTGIELREAGMDFDAVRMPDRAGEDAMNILRRLTAYVPGPVLSEYGGRWFYFLVPPRTARNLTWPKWVTLCAPGEGETTYVGVPGLSGATGSLQWLTLPTAERPYVCAYLLERVVKEIKREAADLP